MVMYTQCTGGLTNSHIYPMHWITHQWSCLPNALEDSPKVMFTQCTGGLTKGHVYPLMSRTPSGIE